MQPGTPVDPLAIMGQRDDGRHVVWPYVFYLGGDAVASRPGNRDGCVGEISSGSSSLPSPGKLSFIARVGRSRSVAGISCSRTGTDIKAVVKTAAKACLGQQIARFSRVCFKLQAEAVQVRMDVLDGAPG